MPAYGVTPAGFLRKPLSQIIADAKARLQATFGANADFSDDGPLGQLIADISAGVDEPWQLNEDVFDSFDPDAALGARLDAICAITGTVRKTPTKSTVTGIAIGTAGTTVLAGTRIQVVASGPLFQTKADALIAALIAWATGTPYAVGDLRKNDVIAWVQNTPYVLGDLRKNGGNVYKALNNGNSANPGPGPSGQGADFLDGTVHWAFVGTTLTAAYRCITPGNSAGAGAGPSSANADIADNVAHWRFLGLGSAAVADDCESVDFGAIGALAYTLTSIVNGVAGLSSFTNPLDAVPGQAEETDAQLRVRREAELAAQGEGGVESLRADLLKVIGVTAALAFENPTDVVDGDGLEPHSVECVVLGGVDADVAKTVFTKGGGIYTHGTTLVVLTDSQGFNHNVRFTRPVEKDVYVTVELTKDGNYPADGDTQVKQALVDFANGLLADIGLGNGYQIGDDVIQTKLYAPVFDRVSGVVDVTKLWIKLSFPPTGAANIVIGTRELAKFDSGRITVLSA